MYRCIPAGSIRDATTCNCLKILTIIFSKEGEAPPARTMNVWPAKNRAVPTAITGARTSSPRTSRPGRLRRGGCPPRRGSPSRGRPRPTQRWRPAGAASSTGSPLPKELRGELEAALGTQLDGVAIHTGSAANDAAKSLSANAYAQGQDIYFGAGKYDPSSSDGKRLIAHEVAHTVQQRNASSVPATQADLEVSQPGDSHEIEAEGFAQAFTRGNASMDVTPVSTGAVSRQLISRDPPTTTPAPAADPAAAGGETAPGADITPQQRTDFIAACHQCTPMVVRAFAHMTSYMQHVSDSYTGAWETHVHTLEEQGASDALLTEFIVSALLGFMTGAVGGGVAMIVTKAVAGDVISDAIKDMAKAGVKNAAGHIPGPSGLTPVSMNPREFSRGQGDYMRGQVEFASQQIERWIRGARTQDPDFDMSFDPVATTTAALHLDDGTDMLSAPLPDVTPTSNKFELGFWKEWLIKKGWTAMGVPSRWGMFYHAHENQGKDVRNRINALGENGDQWLDRYGGMARRRAEADARRMNDARHG